jgi:type IV secretion system protein VirB4
MAARSVAASRPAFRAVARDLIDPDFLFADQSPARHIPYLRHVDDHVVALKDGSYAAFVTVGGICAQTMDFAEINVFMEARNTLVRALGDARYAVQATVIRRRIRPELPGRFLNPRMAEFDARYFAGLAAKKMFVNEMVLTFVRRRPASLDAASEGLLARLGLGRRRLTLEREADVLAEFRERLHAIVAALQPYGAVLMGCRRTAQGLTVSEPLSFLSSLMAGGVSRPAAVARAGIDRTLGARRLIFGRRAVQFDGVTETETRFGAILSLLEYPAESSPAMFDGLLHVPREMIVSQSFQILDRPIADTRINVNKGRTTNSDEAGTSVEEEFEYARDVLASGTAVFGTHHLTIMALGTTPKEMAEATAEIGAELDLLALTYVREDANFEPCFWAQLPGNFAYIARDALVSSKNFASFVSLHNFPVGKREGAKWGGAITLLQTTSLTPYHFNLHVGDVGNFTVFGPTGVGKTVLMLVLGMQAQRLDPPPKFFFFDKDRGAEILFRAVGGQYERLTPGEATGFNPLQLEGTAADRAFLFNLLRFMLRPRDGQELSTSEEQILMEAVALVFELEPQARRLSELPSVLGGVERANRTDLVARLQPWIGKGPRAWLFDNASDELQFGARFAGFDMTHVLRDDDICGAGLMYLFHRIEREMTGEPVLLFLDEVWHLLKQPVFRAFIIDRLKTIRKKNGAIGLGTQSAQDVLEVPGWHAIVEQTKTNIFFPNPKADEAAHREVFRLSAKEFEWIRTTLPASRAFLIRHERDSVIARLDLGHLPDWLNLISGREENLAVIERVIAAHGPDPDAWVPVFLRETAS